MYKKKNRIIKRLDTSTCTFECIRIHSRRHRKGCLALQKFSAYKSCVGDPTPSEVQMSRREAPTYISY